MTLSFLASLLNNAACTVVKTISLGGGATDDAGGMGDVWVSDEAAGRVMRVDTHSDQVTASFVVGIGPNAIAIGDGHVWGRQRVRRQQEKRRWVPSQGSNTFYRNVAMPDSMMEAFPPPASAAPADEEAANPWSAVSVH